MRKLKLKILDEVFYNESIKLEVRLLRLVALYSVAALILAVPCFMIAGYDISVYIAAGISLLLLAGVFGIYIYTKDVRLVSLLFCYVINLIILPLLAAVIPFLDVFHSPSHFTAPSRSGQIPAVPF